MNKLFKKMLCVSFAVVLVLSLVSCGDSTNIELKADGSGSFYSRTEISEAELEKAKDVLINNPNSEMAKFLNNDMSVNKDNIDDYIADIKENFKKQNSSTGTIYYKEETSTFNNEKERNYIFNDPEEGELLNADVCATDIHWTADTLDAKKIDLGWNKVYIIKMPYKVTKTNGVKKDDYTVEFNNSKDKFLYVVTEKSTASWTKDSNINSALQTIDNKKTVESHKPPVAEKISVNYNTKNSLRITFESLADKFIIQRKVGNGKWQNYKTVNSTNLFEGKLIDKKIKPNTKYSYRIKSVNLIKNTNLVSESNFSKTISFKTMNFKTKPIVKSVKFNRGKVVVKLKKKVSNVTGYQFQYSSDKKFKKSVRTIRSTKTTQNIKKLNTKKHYIRVRTYKKVGNKYFYGVWSKTFVKK